MKTPSSFSRAARQRGILLAMIFVLMPGLACAKIIQNQEMDGPQADAPLTVQPDAAGPHIDYYLFGALPGWWNQNGAAPRRWPNLMPAIGTATITRSILHNAIALRLAREAERRAVFTNTPRSWRHDKFRGTVLLLRSFRNETGLLCRDFSHTVTIDAVDNRLGGTACRQGDGTWLLVGENDGLL
jgi:surface antigen